MKLGEIILEGKNAPDWSVIYIIKCDDEILYIGKSKWVENRLAQHLGYSGPPSSGYFDEAARAAIPQ
jgi:predicted GIY-YIG superfamily endonuclease